jgi:hypothetical protein
MEIPLSWLTKCTTYEQAVRDNLHNSRPFGNASDDWERLKSKMQPGDELWYFEPPDKTVIQLWGLALVRRDRVVSTVITAVD